MKKTNSLLVFLVVLSTVLFPSCSTIQGPDNWMVDIEDDFRMQIATGLSYALYNEKLVDDCIEQIEKVATEKNNESLEADFAKYKAALEELSKENILANDINSYYSQIKCDFTEFEVLPNEDGYSVWKSKETNSDITVVFKINKSLDWSVELNEEEYVSYLSKLVQRIMDIMSTPESLEKILTQTVKTAYSGQIDDEILLTPEFYKNLHQAMDIDGDLDSWAKIGYWKYSNGSIHQCVISGIDTKNESSPYVYLTLDGTKEIAIELKKDGDVWRINDILGIEEGSVSYSLWDFATVEVAEHNSDHEGN